MIGNGIKYVRDRSFFFNAVLFCAHDQEMILIELIRTTDKKNKGRKGKVKNTKFTYNY